MSAILERSSYRRSGVGRSLHRASGVPGFVANGLEALYLMDVERRNLLLRSEQFDDASWAKSSASVTANDATDQSGLAVADRITASAADGTILQTVSGLSGSHTFSVYLKRHTGSGNVQLTVNGGSTWTTVAVTSTWTRFTLTGTPTSVGMRVRTSGDAVLASGAQLNKGSTALPYVPTTNKQALYDYSGNGRHATRGSVGSAFICPVGEKHLSLPGTSGNYVRTASSTALDVTGDLDIRARARFADWRPGGTKHFVSRGGAGNLDTFTFELRAGGELRLVWRDSVGTLNTPATSPVTGVADGAMKWVRATLDVDNEAGGYTLRYFLSDDGNTWTQLGADVVGGATTDIDNGTNPFYVGSFDDAFNVANADFFRAQVYDGIDGTLVADFNPDRDAHGDVSRFTSSTTGEVWTVNQASASDTNDGTWTGEGQDFDGTDDKVASLVAATEAFAVEDGTYTGTPTDITTAGALNGVLNAHGRYSRTLAASERTQNQAAATQLLAQRGVVVS